MVRRKQIIYDIDIIRRYPNISLSSKTRDDYTG